MIPRLLKHRLQVTNDTSELVEQMNMLFTGKDKQSAESGIVGSSGAAGGKVAVVELLKLPKAMKDIFGAVRGEYGECLRPSEVSKNSFLKRV